MDDANRTDPPDDGGTSRWSRARDDLARTALLLWVLAAAVALLEYGTGPGARLWATGWVGRVEAVAGALGLALVFFAFYQAARILRRLSGTGPDRVDDADGDGDGTEDVPLYRYPDPVTVRVFAWLVISTTVAACLLVLVLASGPYPSWLPDVVAVGTDRAAVSREALVTMLAGGVGSSVATILGFLKHASELKDFDRSYVPWFVARPLMGMLVGLIFYFLIRGGMLATFPDLPSDGAESLDEWALAGIGSLVGLFSKHAVEKLRELFDTLFRTKEATEKDLLGRLPPELREKVRQHLQESRFPEDGATNGAGAAAETEEDGADEVGGGGRGAPGEGDEQPGGKPAGGAAE